MAERKFDGLYRTKRDGGLLYSFHASWEEAGTGISWHCKVVFNRKVAGSPFGYFDSRTKPDIRAEIEKRIAHHIESQIGVR